MIFRPLQVPISRKRVGDEGRMTENQSLDRVIREHAKVITKANIDELTGSQRNAIRKGMCRGNVKLRFQKPADGTKSVEVRDNSRIGRSTASGYIRLFRV